MSQSTFATHERQLFSFPFHVMNHIYANATSNLWKKLNQTCKYFFARFKNLIIDDLKISYAPISAHGYSIVIPPEHKFFEKMENIWLTKSLSLQNYSTPEYYDVLMKKLQKWDIEKLEVGGDLKVEIFNKLTKYGNIQHLTISSVGEVEGNIMAVEEILLKVPYANRIT
uniref:Uncharacterized protein n=1 Tax=Panagrolaimus davidi TaxID=227884 RepID=A0A914PJD7_9BILA